MNVAVGGTGSFFPNWPICRNKPWKNKSPTAIEEFTSAWKDWWPTWGGDLTKPEAGPKDAAAMMIDWVRYWEPGQNGEAIPLPAM